MSITTGRLIDRRNRFGLFVLGLVLLALGIAGLLIQAEILTRYLAVDSPGSYYQQVRDLARDYPGWTIAAFIVVGLLLLLLGLSWIRRQVSTPTTRVREVTLQDDAAGSTVVDADVVSHALARDLERVPDVHDASARLLTAGARPKVAVRATVDGAADMSSLRNDIEQVYRRVSQVLGSDGVEANLHVKPVPSRRSRIT
jgi:hypothetical protein